MSVWYTVLALLSISTTGETSHLGLRFTLAFPEIERCETTLFLFTLEMEDINVSLSRTMPEKEDTILIETITVSKYNETSHLLDLSLLFTPILGTGHQGMFLLEAEKPFGIHVHFFISPSYFGSLLVMPVTSWGRKYYVVTLQSHPFVVMMTDSPNRVRLTFNVSPQSSLALLYDKIYYRDGNSFRFRMRSLEAFILSGCLDINVKVISLTGSLIESHEPLGAITGSCSSFMKEEGCDSYGLNPNRDFAAEMLHPLFMTGTTFYVVNIHERNTNELLVVVAVETHTEGRVYYSRQFDFMTFKMDEKGGVFYINLLGVKLERGSRLVNATKPIVLASIVTSTCQDNRLSLPGGPSICLILPDTLFYHTYVWRNPLYQNTKHYAALVGTKNVIDNITLVGSEDTVNLYLSDELYGISGVYERHYLLQLEQSSHVVVITGPGAFGCYFYGLGYGAYFSPGGLFYNDIIIDECIDTIPKPGDVIDNDCDGNIDEETANQKDDDGDGFCDEDFDVSGQDHTYSFTWGLNCTNSCAQCVDVCHTIDGYCEECKPGFKGHQIGCSIECGPNEYGANCLGNCEEKCGTDCYDRQTGECQESNDLYYITALSLTLISAVLVLMYLMTKKDKKVRKKKKHVPKSPHVHKHHHRGSKTSRASRASKSPKPPKTKPKSHRRSHGKTARLKKAIFGTNVDDNADEESSQVSLDEELERPRPGFLYRLFFGSPDSKSVISTVAEDDSV